MRELYSEKDLERINAQLKKRYLALGAALAVILAFVVWSFTLRIEWLSVVTAALFFAVGFFVIDLFCRPLLRYRSLVTSALNGRTHIGTFEFDRVEEDPSQIDGVTCRGLIFLGEADKHGIREQRYYWDGEFPLPDFRKGDQITLKYTGNHIIGYQC